MLFVSTIESLLKHCASTPFRRFVANTLSPTSYPPLVNTHVRVLYAPVLLFLSFFFLFFSFRYHYRPFHRFVNSSITFISISVLLLLLYIHITSRKVHIKSSISILQHVEHVEQDVSFSILHLYTRNYILYSELYANDSKNEYVRTMIDFEQSIIYIYIVREIFRGKRAEERWEKGGSTMRSGIERIRDVAQTVKSKSITNVIEFPVSRLS